MISIEERKKYISENIEMIKTYYLEACSEIEKKQTLLLMNKDSELTEKEINEIFCDIIWSRNEDKKPDQCTWFAFSGEYTENLEIWNNIIGLPLSFILK